MGRAFELFGFEVSYYGIIMGLAILAGMGLVLLIARYTGQHMEDYLDLAIVTIPAAILGARLFYVIFSWKIYKDSLLSIFAIWEGGLAFYGALLAGFIAVIIFCRIRMLWTAEVLDTVALGVLFGQVIGSWGNFFNREAIGEYTEGLLAMQLPLDDVRIADVSDRMRNHLVEIEGARFLQSHPVFLYVSIWSLVLLIILVVYQYNKEFDGEIFGLYIAGDNIGRFIFGGLQVEVLTGTRVISIILVLVAVAWVLYNRLGDAGSAKRRMRQKNAKRSLMSSRKMFHGM